MVSVAEAERIILQQVQDYGTELIPFEQAMGRVLAESIVAERDIPACDKATMDGIAIEYNAFAGGIRTFRIKATIAAGNAPVATESAGECVEIMTGAPVDATQDTVVRYEDLDITDGVATIKAGDIKKGQNIHKRGKDKLAGELMVAANTVIDATIISVAASMGLTQFKVKRTPRTVIITTGDELVAINEQPTPYQLRSSNNYMLKAVLQQYAVNCELLHVPDEPDTTKEIISQCIAEYEVIILTGGVSMGKYDYVPQALAECGVQQLFHKVMQRPGKPFWFGKHENGALIFAFPGNPVSTFMCATRYLLPWLKASLVGKISGNNISAILGEDVTFTPQLQYFMQVDAHINENGQLVAYPVQGNGSGDFPNLAASNAFMELPAEQTIFNKGALYRIWPFKPII